MLVDLEQNKQIPASPEFVRIKQMAKLQNQEFYLVEWMDDDGGIFEKWEPLFRLSNYMLQVAQAKKIHTPHLFTQEQNNNFEHDDCHLVNLFPHDQNQSFEVESSELLTEETAYQQHDFMDMRLVSLQVLQNPELRYAVELAYPDRRIETFVLSSEVLKKHFRDDFARLLEAKSF